ncbi:hypothetical protein [Phenylobacterium aquaticum]|uniref:hypothetical protein n=1 Tax=Phenylobacterium aquaticum TaxID=1763816 RepID=UPI0026EC74E1|nr:hypothetical protein [Phenylobacterium aquaticum]
MTTKKPPPQDEDLEQSKRFLDLAKELEDAGELDPTESEAAFERAFRKAVPERRSTRKPEVS